MGLFAGMTVLLVVAAAVAKSPFVLLVAVPFAVVTGLLWYHVSGRMRERVRRKSDRAARRERQRRRAAATGRRASGSGGGRGPAGSRRSRRQSRRKRRQAYRTLGLEPGADEASVREAYRERVKEVHPDAEDGDESEFRRVNEAYERLTDEEAT